MAENPPPKFHSTAYGMALILISTLFFAVMALGVRFSRGHFSALSLVFYRSLIQSLILLPGGWTLLVAPGLSKRFFWHLPRGIFGISAMLGIYFALQRLPMGLASLLSMTSVLWAAILGRWFLKEKLKLPQILLSLLVGLGICLSLFSGPDEGRWRLDILGMASGLIAGLMMSLAQIWLRKMGKTTSARETVLFFGLCGSGLMLPLFLWRGDLPAAPSDLLEILWVGIFATAGQLFLTEGFRHAPVVLGSLCNLQGTLWSIGLGMLFLEEFPPVGFFVGGFLVLVGLSWLLLLSTSAIRLPETKSVPQNS